MEINIGVRNTQRELSVDVDLSPEAVNTLVETAVETGKPLMLKDTGGRSVIIPSAALGYVEISAQQSRRVGFGLAE